MKALKHALKNINSDFGGFLDEVLNGEVFEVEAWSENAECYALERLEKRGLNLAFTRVKTTSHRRDWLLSEAKKINQIAAHNIIFFTNAERLSICLAPRRQNRATSHAADVVEKYIFIKDIELERPNYGHLLNLQSLQAAQMGDSLESYYANLVENLSIQGLNDRFYGELVAIFREFVRTITLPKDSHCLANSRPAANPSRTQNHRPADNRAESSAQVFTLRLFSRLLFCKFLEKKGVLPREIWDVDVSPLYYHEVLEPLFFATLNTPKEARKPQLNQRIQALLDAIPYLNGGLFAPHFEDFYDPAHPRANAAALIIPNALFTRLFGLFERYHFSIDENSDENVLEIALDPELLGCVFERLLGELYPENAGKKGAESVGETADENEAAAKSESKTAAASESKAAKINAATAAAESAAKNSKRKETGSYYTPREIVRYIVRGALEAHLGARFGGENGEKLKKLIHLGENCFGSESAAVRTALDSLKILDPACGSGAFPMQCLHEILRLQGLLEDSRPASARKLEILQNAIFGVDIQPMATEIARLRCFLSIIIDEEIIKPLPNLEFKFVSANALIGLEAKKGAQCFDDLTDYSELDAIRAQFFTAKPHEKPSLQGRFIKTQRSLAKRLFIGTAGKEAQKISWNPFEDSRSAPFFDPAWMFGVENFDIVLGNPPYGAKINQSDKKLYKTNYEYAIFGAIDTYKLFIERGFKVLNNNGVLSYIVPLSVTSSKSNIALHKMLLKNCRTIQVSGYGDRPAKVFSNAEQKCAILTFTKTNTECVNLLTSKVNKRTAKESLDSLFGRIRFVDSLEFYQEGAFCKIDSEIEVAIMRKIYRQSVKVKDLMDSNGRGIYYRDTGNRYYNLITTFSTGSGVERCFSVRANLCKAVAAILSSNLYFWFKNAYSDNRHSYVYEFERFCVPELGNEVVGRLEKLCDEYEADINAKANFTSTGTKEYRLRKSKHIIDRIDDVICPLYGLTDEECAFVKNYEAEFRCD